MRILPRREVPTGPSIFEHVREHLRDGRLPDDATTLPDELDNGDDATTIRWAPGALEGAFSRYASGEPDDAAAQRIHGALVAAADRPGRARERHVRALFREGEVRARIDGVLERLQQSPPREQGRLHSQMRELLVRSGHRDEVKYAIAITALFGDETDGDLFRTIGRHAEFTLYAAVALANVVDDPLAEWLDLLRHVDGWGRTELSELVLREPQPEAVRVEVLRHGLGIGNALTLAVGCRLHEVLQPDDVDDELLARAGEVVDALTWSFDAPDDLLDYPDAGPAVERLLEHFLARPATLRDFLTTFELRRFVGDRRGDDERPLAGAAIDDARLERIGGLCATLLDDDGWKAKARVALASVEASERWQGVEVSKRLGVDLRPYLRDAIEHAPDDAGLWFELVRGASRDDVAAAVALALDVWDLDEIATGPALDLFAGATGPPAAVDCLLQELVRFPDLGGPIVLASLRSPVIRHRHRALRVLSCRDALDDAARAAVTDVAAGDPDDDVRGSARKVLRGEPIDDDDGDE